jgi:hypothetical protein
MKFEQCRAMREGSERCFRTIAASSPRLQKSSKSSRVTLGLLFISWEAYFRGKLKDPPRDFVIKFLEKVPSPESGSQALDLGAGRWP